MLALKGRTHAGRVSDIIRELLILQEGLKGQKKKRAANYFSSVVSVIKLHELEGGKIVMSHTDGGVLVDLPDCSTSLLFNKSTAKGGPKFTIKATSLGSTSQTKGSTRWVETLIKKTGIR